MGKTIKNTKRVNSVKETPPGKFKFSRTEIMHIAVAIVVLSIAFWIILWRGGSIIYPGEETKNMLALFAMSVILVVFSFLVHELAHKFVSQHYNAWSEFRAFPMGLALALITALAGLLFAAPGAVYIRGKISVRENGIISLAGPGVNFLIAAIAIVVSLSTYGITSGIFASLAILNAFLGIFNLIPIPPFDGSKIVAWNIPIYAILGIVGIIQLYICYTII